MRLDYKPYISDISGNESQSYFNGFDITKSIPAERIEQSLKLLKITIAYGVTYQSLEIYSCLHVAAPHLLVDFAGTKLASEAEVTNMLNRQEETYYRDLAAICFWVKLARPQYDFSPYLLLDCKNNLIESYNRSVPHSEIIYDTLWYALLIRVLFPDTAIDLSLIDQDAALAEVTEPIDKGNIINRKSLLAIKILFPHLLTPDLVNSITREIESSLFTMSYTLPPEWHSFWQTAAVLTILNCEKVTLNEEGVCIMESQSSGPNSISTLPSLLHI